MRGVSWLGHRLPTRDARHVCRWVRGKHGCHHRNSNDGASLIRHHHHQLERRELRCNWSHEGRASLKRDAPPLCGLSGASAVSGSPGGFSSRTVCPEFIATVPWRPVGPWHGIRRWVLASATRCCRSIPLGILHWRVVENGPISTQL